MIKEISPEKTVLSELKSMLVDFKAHCVFWPLAIAGLFFDLWTKHAVFKMLEPDEAYVVINGFLELVIRENNGAAWSIFSGKTTLLIAVASIAMLAIIIFFIFSGKQPRIIHIAMGLFAGGVSGNLYDRIFNEGHVRDFVRVYYKGFEWPTFNVADSMLCIGVGLLIISTIFFTEKPAQTHDQPQK
ncbi:MAG: signal peptidase II [Sedimentisphaerales bacterium]|nr:signal peptidase II [Sedimentisphaerales bacterium]